MSDLEKYLEMINGSDFCKPYRIVDGTIEFQGDMIPTKEVVMLDERSYAIVMIFCASDESFITIESRDKVKKIQYKGRTL